MKKDNIRDYATSAFRSYARYGCPTTEEYINDIRQNAASGIVNPQEALKTAEAAEKEYYSSILDVAAVNATIELLKDNGKYEIVDAVRAVYFVNSDKKLYRKSITERAQAFADSCPADISTVFRYLAYARRLFAKYRGLTVRKTCE